MVNLWITLLGVGFEHKRLSSTMGIDVPRNSSKKFLTLEFWVWIENGFRVFEEACFLSCWCFGSVYFQQHGNKEEH
jgi:hypothetical protein